jgi:hypothetical protein
MGVESEGRFAVQGAAWCRERDLSDPSRGNLARQPISNEEKGVWIILIVNLLHFLTLPLKYFYAALLRDKRQVGVIRDEAEHQFRDEAEQFQADPGKVFGFAGMISTGS